MHFLGATLLFEVELLAINERAQPSIFQKIASDEKNQSSQDDSNVFEQIDLNEDDQLSKQEVMHYSIIILISSSIEDEIACW